MVPSRLDLDQDWEAQLKQTIQDNLQPILLDTKLAYEHALHQIPVSSSTHRQGLTIKYETAVKELQRNAEEQFARERERGRKEREQMMASHRRQVISGAQAESRKDWGAVFEEQQAILQAIQRSKVESSSVAMSPDLEGPSPSPSTPTSVQGLERALGDQVSIQSPICHPFASESQVTADHTTDIIQHTKPMSVNPICSPSSQPVELKRRTFEEQQEKFRQRELQIKRNFERKRLQDQLNWEESLQLSLSSSGSSVSSGSSTSSASSSSSATSSVASSPVLSGFPLIYAHSKTHIPTRKASNPLPAPPSPVNSNYGRRLSVSTFSASAAASSPMSKPITITSRPSGASRKVQDAYADFAPSSYYNDPAFSATPPASSPHLAPSFPPYLPTAFTAPTSMVAILPRDTHKQDAAERIKAIYSQHEQQWQRIAAYHELLWSDFPWPVLAERTSSGLPPSSTSATYPRQISSTAHIASFNFSGLSYSQHIQSRHNRPNNHSRNQSSHYQHGQQYHYHIQHQHSSYHYPSPSLFSHSVTPPHSASLSSPYSNISLHSNSVVLPSASTSVMMARAQGETPPVVYGASPSPITSLPTCPSDLNFQAVRAYMLSPYYPTPGITGPDSRLASVTSVNQDTNTSLMSPTEIKEEQFRMAQIQRDRVKEQIRKWHPDRFQLKFLRKIREEKEREMVREGVQVLLRWLSEVLKEVEMELRDN